MARRDLIVLLLLSVITMSTNTIDVITWNVTGVMSSSSYLCDVITEGKIDICGISEHWLYPHNMFFLDCISSDYNCHGVCDKDLYWTNERRKVGKGGVCIMWRKQLDNFIVPLSIESDRIVGIQLQLLNNQYIYMFQVYLPSSNHSLNEYRECMTILYDLYHTYRDQGLVVFMGDFNARVNSIRSSTRDDCLKGFLLDCNLCAINQTQLRYGPRDTFVSYDNQSASTIDYVCIPVECTDLVTHCEVAGDACLNVSRHRPILCSFDCPGRMEAECASEKTTNWKKCL